MKAAMIGRGLLWALLVLMLLVLLFLTGSVWLIGVLAMMLALTAGSVIWNRTACKSVQVKIDLPAGARKNAETDGSVRALFERPPLGRVYCALELGNDLTGETQSLRLPMERTREGFEAQIALCSAHCGRIRLEASRVTVTDFFGFLPGRRTVSAEGRMTVLPETFPVEIDVSMLSAPQEGDDVRDDRKGSDRSETFQLRDYQPGDDLHSIHWKLTGKLDKLIYREPSQPVSNALLLYWDQSSGTPEQLDALAEAVFSVGQSLCQMGVPFTVGKTEQGAVITREIAELDALIEQFPMLLRRRGAERPALTALAAFGRVFYFTASVPEGDCDEAVQVFLCGDETGASGNEITFTPHNAADVLERLGGYGA